MNEAIKRMMERYDIQTPGDSYNALREIIQEVALYGLWDANFFKDAAFYGGTALRIFYGLDRFSEDMDFSLLSTNLDFSFEPYRNRMIGALENMGFSVEFSTRMKLTRGNIRSAFLKSNTLSHLMDIVISPELVGARHPREKITIKIEVDVDPAGGFDTEFLAALNPIPHNVRVYVPPCLFAGKMHALLFREWGERVKGRDWYDMVKYLQRNTPVYIPYLESKMRQSGDWSHDRSLEKDHILSLYREKAASLDVEKAIADVRPFLKHPAEVENTWSNAFFLSLERLFTFQE
jgi:predicted nucleotidyltransferase component of viral defense system